MVMCFVCKNVFPSERSLGGHSRSQRIKQFPDGKYYWTCSKQKQGEEYEIYGVKE
jgi:hypothetical protein